MSAGGARNLQKSPAARRHLHQRLPWGYRHVGRSYFDSRSRASRTDPCRPLSFFFFHKNTLRFSDNLPLSRAREQIFPLPPSSQEIGTSSGPFRSGSLSHRHHLVQRLGWSRKRLRQFLSIYSRNYCLFSSSWLYHQVSSYTRQLPWEWISGNGTYHSLARVI